MTTTENRWNGPDTPAAHDVPAPADSPVPTPGVNDELAVDALLADNDLDEHGEDLLRPFLMELRSLVPDAPPVPSPDLAALLAQSAAHAHATATEALPTPDALPATEALSTAEAATVTNLDTYRARHGKAPRGIIPGRTVSGTKIQRRAALTAVAVVASLGAAAGAAAAADGDFLAHAQDNISVFFNTLTNQRPADDPAPTPGNAQNSTTGTSAPAGTESPATTPKPSTPVSPAATHPVPGLDVQVPKVPGHESETIPGIPGPAQATLPPSIPSEVPTTVPGSTVVPAPSQLKPGTDPEH